MNLIIEEDVFPFILLMKNNNGLVKTNKISLKLETENKLIEESEKELKHFLDNENNEETVIKIGLKLFKLILTDEMSYKFLTKENVEKLKQIIDYKSENFYYENIIKHFKENNLENMLLNNVVKTLNGCLKNEMFNGDYFIKPLTDLKDFDAFTVKKESYLKEILNQHINFYNFYQKTKGNMKIIASPLNNDIDFEYRCIVYKGEVISTSLYFDKRKELFLEQNIENDNKEYGQYEDMLKLFNEMAKIYQPSELFVMDVAEMKDGSYKILEYNNFICSDLYECNFVNVLKEKMIKRVQQKIDDKIKEKVLKENIDYFLIKQSKKIKFL